MMSPPLVSTFMLQLRFRNAIVICNTSGATDHHCSVIHLDQYLWHTRDPRIDL